MYVQAEIFDPDSFAPSQRHRLGCAVLQTVLDMAENPALEAEFQEWLKTYQPPKQAS